MKLYWAGGHRLSRRSLTKRSHCLENVARRPPPNGVWGIGSKMCPQYICGVCDLYLWWDPLTWACLCDSSLSSVPPPWRWWDSELICWCRHPQWWVPLPGTWSRESRGRSSPLCSWLWSANTAGCAWWSTPQTRTVPVVKEEKKKESALGNKLYILHGSATLYLAPRYHIKSV